MILSWRSGRERGQRKGVQRIFRDGVEITRAEFGRGALFDCGAVVHVEVAHAGGRHEQVALVARLLEDLERRAIGVDREQARERRLGVFLAANVAEDAADAGASGWPNGTSRDRTCRARTP